MTAEPSPEPGYALRSYEAHLHRAGPKSGIRVFAECVASARTMLLDETPEPVPPEIAALLRYTDFLYKSIIRTEQLQSGDAQRATKLDAVLVPRLERNEIIPKTVRKGGRPRKDRPVQLMPREDAPIDPETAAAEALVRAAGGR